MNQIDRAAELLRNGGTVAIPTETVYGLGANALDVKAVAAIFAAKERPSWDPLIVHISDRSMLLQVVDQIPASAQKLMDAFWPGPLTLLLPRSKAVPAEVTAGRDLVGVRMPSHPVALQIIAKSGVPIAAPSANRFGHVSPTTAQHVLDDLDGRIDAVLDGGPCDVGVESTVLDPTQTPMVLYRPGAITREQIEAVAGPTVAYRPPVTPSEPQSLPSPGVGIRHYAPRARVRLITTPADAASADANSILLLPGDWAAPAGARTISWGRFDQPETLASSLYAKLREADETGTDEILVPVPAASEQPLIMALRDRLEKAARVR